MIDNLSVLGIILARGGSKRIPRKNIKILAGKPLIVHSIESAKKSHYIDRLILSTDDLEIAQVAQSAECEVPFMRPANLSGDNVTDYPVIMHALTFLREHEGYEPDIVVQLRPTSPLRTTRHIDDVIELLAAHPEADSIRTIAEPEQSPYKMYRVGQSGYLEPLFLVDNDPESFNWPAAKLPKTFKHVGYVDAAWRRTLVEKGRMTGEFVLPFIVEGARSGINTPEDWELYEFLMRDRAEAV